MKILAFSMMVLRAVPQFAGADEDYAAIQAADKRYEHVTALDLAEKFARDFPNDIRLKDVLRVGGRNALVVTEPERAEVLFRRLLKDFPDKELNWEWRAHLCDALRTQGKLEELIAECDSAIRERLGSGQYRAAMEEWRYLRGESLLKLWRFEEAEKELKACLEESGGWIGNRYRGDPKALLVESINPTLSVGKHGVVEGYKGKYLEDVRFRRVMKTLPEKIDQACSTLKATLGVDVPLQGTLLKFEDAPRGSNAEFRGTTTRICIGYKPFNLVTLHTEFMVLKPEDFATRLACEFNDAAFLTLMGQRYFALPEWLRAGLATYGARQIEDRTALVLWAAWNDHGGPLSILDGVPDRDWRHDARDYLEDALSFQWLESLKTGNVHAFCRRLISGDDYRTVFAELAGRTFDVAMADAQAYCRRRVDVLLGEPRLALDRIRTGQRGAERDRCFADWFGKSGEKDLAEWLKENASHVLAPEARNMLGQGLLKVGRLVEGRRWLAHVRDHDSVRSTLAPYAQYEIADSYSLSDNQAERSREFGVFLRDYSWSPIVKRVTESKPAGPVTEEEEKASKGEK